MYCEYSDSQQFQQGLKRIEDKVYQQSLDDRQFSQDGWIKSGNRGLNNNGSNDVFNPKIFNGSNDKYKDILD